MSVKIDPLLGLPEIFKEWRDDQYTATVAIENCTKPHFLGDIPVGVGKSLIGVGAHKILKSEKTIYTCGTKQLQDQILRDFAGLAVSLKGKSNYPCAAREDEFPQITADDCSLSSPSACKYYSNCGYYQQREIARNSPLVVLNNAYFLNEANGFYPSFSGNQLLIADEVDALDNALMSFVEFRITTRQLEKYGLIPPYHPEKKESWIEWIPGTVDKLKEKADKVGYNLRFSNFMNWDKNDIEKNRSRKTMEKLAGRLNDLKIGLDYSWVFYSSYSNGVTEWVFKPVNVGSYAKRYLWKHAEFSIGMSGTILDPNIMCKELGIQNCDYMQLPSPFPVKNRPIHYKPVVNLKRSSMSTELPILKNAIEEDLKNYQYKKVLIHTVSYTIRNYLLETLQCKERLVSHESNNREEWLAKFKSSKYPLVMLSPSFDRGVDLREEDNCAAVFICKVPYMSLGDPQVKAKTETPGGWDWYFMKAIQTVMQMTGRHIRSVEQCGDTIIYDQQFEKLLNKTKDIIPYWWKDAIIYHDMNNSKVKIGSMF